MKKGYPFRAIYKNFEDEFLEIARNIRIDDSQVNVYSEKIANLLVLCAVQIESISKELYLENGGVAKKNLYFDSDCIKFLNDKWNICNKIIYVSSPYFSFEKEENIILTPLKDCDQKHRGDWKNAYQAVKHDSANNLKQGSVRNLIDALGALFILNLYYASEEIDLGVTFQPELDFDSRMGSKIFSVSFVDATKNVGFGEKRTDDAIDQSVLDGLAQSIYVLRYNSSSWNEIHDSILKANETIVDELSKSEAFKKDVTEGKIDAKHILELVSKYLGKDFLRKYGPFNGFSLALNRAHREAVLYRNQPIYG